MNLCLLSVYVLNVIPYRIYFAPDSFAQEYGILPGYGLFILICVAALLLFLYFFIRTQKRGLDGPLVTRKRGKKISRYLALMGILALAVTSLDFRGHGQPLFLYHYVILTSFLTYLILTSMWIERQRPVSLVLQGKSILYKTDITIRKIDVEGLNQIRYEFQRRILILHFREGLHDIFLSLREYDEADLRNLIRSLTEIRGNSILASDAMTEYIQGLRSSN